MVASKKRDEELARELQSDLELEEEEQQETRLIAGRGPFCRRARFRKPYCDT